MTTFRILLLSGSLRAASTNGAVLRAAAATAPGEVVCVASDHEASLPHFSPDDDVEPAPAPVVALRRAIADADALLVCTPEYAGALPGAFKNLLDWTVGGIGMEMDAKPVGWINAAAPVGRAAGAHDELRTVLDYLNATIVEAACAAIPVTRDAIGDDGVITDPEVRARIAEVVAALAAAADQTTSAAAPANWAL